LAKDAINPDNIDKIDVHTFFEVVENYSFLPSIPFDVSFSAPYLIALLINKLSPGQEWFNDKYLEDRKIRDTARKVRINEWEEASKAYPLVKRELMSRVEICEKSGIVHDTTIKIPKGDPRNPMSEHELRNKFHTIVAPVLGTDRSEKLYDRVMDIEHLESIRIITNDLGPDHNY
jgi:2-methylcitrate dehydratase